jgi:site-specific DNA-cytosine methylase
MDKKGCGIGNFGEPAFTVRSGQVDGVAVMEPIPINMQSAIKNGTKSPNGNGIGEPGDPACTLGANDRHAVGVPMTCATLTKNYATHHGRTAGNNGGIAEGQLIPETAVTLRSGPTTKVAHSARSGDKDENLVVHSLRGDGFDASEDGTGRGTPIVIAHGQGNAEQVSDGSPSLTCNHEAPICFEPRMVRTTGGQPQSDLNHTLRADNNSGDGQPCVQHGMAVRRLTPRECERLQGFLDDYTKIPSAFVLKLGIEPDPNNPKHWAADGPRYKAIGNSFAVPCVRWIGERIEAIEKLKP